MKRLLLFLLASMAILSCEEKKENISSNANTLKDSILISDSTVYGHCAEAGMSTMLLAMPNDDTIEYIIPADNNIDKRIVLGGLYPNDKIAVTFIKNEDEENIATRIINISTLFGKWSNGNENINIEEGSSNWKILNGQLLLKKDTFDIYDLGPDSLILEDKQGIYNYVRGK